MNGFSTNDYSRPFTAGTMFFDGNKVFTKPRGDRSCSTVSDSDESENGDLAPLKFDETNPRFNEIDLKSEEYDSMTALQRIKLLDEIRNLAGMETNELDVNSLDERTQYLTGIPIDLRIYDRVFAEHFYNRNDTDIASISGVDKRIYFLLKPSKEPTPPNMLVVDGEYHSDSKGKEKSKTVTWTVEQVNEIVDKLKVAMPYNLRHLIYREILNSQRLRSNDQRLRSNDQLFRSLEKRVRVLEQKLNVDNKVSEASLRMQRHLSDESIGSLLDNTITLPRIEGEEDLRSLLSTPSRTPSPMSSSLNDMECTLNSLPCGLSLGASGSSGSTSSLSSLPDSLSDTGSSGLERTSSLNRSREGESLHSPSPQKPSEMPVGKPEARAASEPEGVVAKGTLVGNALQKCIVQ